MRYLSLAAVAAFLLASNFALACLEAPLPTTPSGPTWSEVYESRLSSGTLLYSAEVTAWRHVCPSGEPLLLMTFEAVEDTPFICSVAFDVIQGGAQYGNFRLHQSPGGSSFCGDLLVKSTFVIEQRTFDPQWDDQTPFSLAWDSDVFLEVGAFNPADYGGEPEDVTLHGSMSGSWYEPARSGEGLVLDFSVNQAGPVASVYWFTHMDGESHWFMGSEQYEEGQNELTIELFEFSGTGFGNAFDPDEIESEQAGTLSLEFDSCDSGFAAWEMNGGETGSFELQRITQGLHGAGCE